MAVVTPMHELMFYHDGPGRYLFGGVITSTSTEVFINLTSLGSTSYAGHYSGQFQTTLSGEITGKVTGFTFSYLGTERVSITDLDLDARQMFNLVGTNDQEGLWTYMFAGDDVFDLRQMKVYGYSQLLNVGGGNDVVHGSQDDDKLGGGSGRDTLFGSVGGDTLWGEAGNDFLYGDSGNDILTGDVGRDRLYGGWDNDRLSGGTGADVIDGGLGNDTLYGGKGADRLTGGLGADDFVLRLAVESGTLRETRDTITDFTRTQDDRIVLAAMDADRTEARNQAFTFIGDDAFGGNAGELRYVAASFGVIVLGDTDGDGRANFSIAVNRLSGMTADDFVL